ncbi:hypothetical protein ETU08_00580, partial [Apibacter muscae]
MNIIEKQILSGESVKEIGLDSYSDYNYTMDDFNEIRLEIVKILLNSGYKKPDNNKFKQYINSYFNGYSNDEIETILLEYPCVLDKIVYQTSFDGVMSYHAPIQIDLKNSFISEAYFIPELIDYQKEYPEISKIENTLKTKKIENGDTLFVQRWKDVPDLAKQRRFNKQLLISRNKYLFNDDKSQFAWLITNDAQFMRSLVTTFGYTEDKKLLNWVIENTDLDLYSLKNKGKFNYEE